MFFLFSEVIALFVELDHHSVVQWMVMPRPEGVRCLVIATGGETVSRKRNGVILHRFASSLPAGSRFVCLFVIYLKFVCSSELNGVICLFRMTNQGKQGACILDCIYQNQTKTYYIIDLMCWKGYDLYDSTTEFRYVEFTCFSFDFFLLFFLVLHRRRFWIDSKLAEISSIGSVTPSVNEFRFLALPSAPLTVQSLADVYQPFAASSNRFGFGQDGILFYNKQAQFRFGPLCFEINFCV
jgi:snurportin-1